MRVIDTLVTRMRFDADLAGLRRAEAGLDRFRARVRAVSAGLGAIGGAATLAGGHAAVSFARAEREAIKLRTQVGLTKAEMEEMNRAGERIGRRWGIAPVPTRQAEFFIQSAGLRGEVAAEALEAAAMAATVDLGDLATMADLLTSAQSAYSGRYSSEKVAGILHATFREGKIADPKSLAPALGRVMGTGAALGVELEEIGAFFAALSRVGFEPSRAASQIDAMWRPILKPPSEVVKRLESVGLSHAWMKETIREHGLMAMLRSLLAAEGGDVVALGQYFDSEAMAGVANMVGEQTQTNLAVIDAIATNSDELREMAALAESTLAHQAQRRHAEMMWAWTEDIGRRLRPTIDRMLDALGDVQKWYDSLGESTQDLIAKSLTLGPALLGVAAALRAVWWALGLGAVSRGIGRLAGVSAATAAAGGAGAAAAAAGGAAGGTAAKGKSLLRRHPVGAAVAAAGGAAAYMARDEVSAFWQEFHEQSDAATKGVHKLREGWEAMTDSLGEAGRQMDRIYRLTVENPERAGELAGWAFYGVPGAVGISFKRLFGELDPDSEDAGERAAVQFIGMGRDRELVWDRIAAALERTASSIEGWAGAIDAAIDRAWGAVGDWFASQGIDQLTDDSPLGAAYAADREETDRALALREHARRRRAERDAADAAGRRRLDASRARTMLTRLPDSDIQLPPDPGDTAGARRMAEILPFTYQLPTAPPAASAPPAAAAAPAPPNVEVSVGDVTVNTQATDAEAVAADIGEQIGEQMRIQIRGVVYEFDSKVGL